MTDIRLVYDPFADQIHIYYEDGEITAAENRICAFLHTHGFRKCLLPFRTKYAVWEGLLAELVQEVNDGELRVVFEGQNEDYELVKEAFSQSGAAVRDTGYKVRWELVHTGRFEVADVAEQLENAVYRLREMCESRAELYEADSLLLQIQEGQVKTSCTALAQLVSTHIEKWEQSKNEYRQEKIVYLEVLKSGLQEVQEQLEKICRAAGTGM